MILPTSLIFNWKREAERFAPALRVLSLHGKERAERFDQIAEHDIVLTTYPLLWRDEEVLAKQDYHLLILDEAQIVKNAASHAAQVVRKLRARHRLCLTGTPLENHLGELWAQFDFLMPGFLGRQQIVHQDLAHADRKTRRQRPPRPARRARAAVHPAPPQGRRGEGTAGKDHHRAHASNSTARSATCTKPCAARWTRKCAKPSPTRASRAARSSSSTRC